MVNGEGKNPVAMTIVNPRKDISNAGDRTSDPMFSSIVSYRLSDTGFVWL